VYVLQGVGSGKKTKQIPELSTRKKQTKLTRREKLVHPLQGWAGGLSEEEAKP
jgi:hypothetical protein